MKSPRIQRMIYDDNLVYTAVLDRSLKPITRPYCQLSTPVMDKFDRIAVTTHKVQKEESKTFSNKSLVL
jgi:hypothetical protein